MRRLRGTLEHRIARRRPIPSPPALFAAPVLAAPVLAAAVLAAAALAAVVLAAPVLARAPSPTVFASTGHGAQAAAKRARAPISRHHPPTLKRRRAPRRPP